jgi:hypothetical protein
LIDIDNAIDYQAITTEISSLSSGIKRIIAQPSS